MVSSNSACRLSNWKGMTMFCFVAILAPAAAYPLGREKRWPARRTRSASLPSVQESRLLESAVDDRRRVQTQPLIEDRRIDAAEIHVRVQIALNQMLGLHRRHLAIMPALDLLAEHKGDSASAVIGARAVVVDATAEL